MTFRETLQEKDFAPRRLRRRGARKTWGHPTPRQGASAPCLSSIGFLGGKRLSCSLATLSGPLPLFARPLFLSLSLLRRRELSLGSRHRLRPGLRHEPSQRQCFSAEQGCQQHQASTL